MKNKEYKEALEEMEQEDCFRRTERIDGPELEGFTPTLQELIQLVKFHIQEFVERHWHAFVNGWKVSQADEDAIWLRLDKIHRVLREDDFTEAVELACMQFGEEVDINIWHAFVYGDQALRRDAALELQQTGRLERFQFSEKLDKRIVEAAQEQEQEIPPEVLLRMAQPMRDLKEEESKTIH